MKTVMLVGNVNLAPQILSAGPQTDATINFPATRLSANTIDTRVLRSTPDQWSRLRRQPTLTDNYSDEATRDFIAVDAVRAMRRALKESEAAVLKRSVLAEKRAQRGPAVIRFVLTEANFPLLDGKLFALTFGRDGGNPIGKVPIKNWADLAGLGPVVIEGSVNLSELARCGFEVGTVKEGQIVYRELPKPARYPEGTYGSQDESRRL